MRAASPRTWTCRCSTSPRRCCGAWPAACPPPIRARSCAASRRGSRTWPSAPTSSSASPARRPSTSPSSSATSKRRGSITWWCSATSASRPVAAAWLRLGALGALALPASAKKFKFAAGPKPPADTTLSVAEVDVEPIVRARGPRVPATNLQLLGLVANTAFDRALAKAPIDTGGRIIVAPTTLNALNFVVEHAILKHLAKRRVSVTMRRTPLPEDSTLAQLADPGQPVLEYVIGATRVTYLRLVGWLPGRVRIERQAQVEGQLVMRDPQTRRGRVVRGPAMDPPRPFPP